MQSISNALRIAINVQPTQHSGTEEHEGRAVLKCACLETQRLFKVEGFHGVNPLLTIQGWFNPSGNF